MRHVIARKLGGSGGAERRRKSWARSVFAIDGNINGVNKNVVVSRDSLAVGIDLVMVALFIGDLVAVRAR